MTITVQWTSQAHPTVRCQEVGRATPIIHYNHRRIRFSEFMYFTDILFVSEKNPLVFFRGKEVTTCKDGNVQTYFYNNRQYFTYF